MIVCRSTKLICFRHEPRLLGFLMSRSHHMERTMNNSRSEIESVARVTEIEKLSPAVKKLRLHVANPALTFKAGQWVDFLIPSVDVVGGYSMCSSPHLLKTERVLELAVKFSRHPPAHWVHTQCEVGSEVAIRVGGDFFFDTTDAANQNKDVLLIGGGVGINPLLSIMSEIADNNLQNKVTLLYSSKTRDEAIFQKEICRICDSHNNINSQYYVTQDQPSGPRFCSGRIGKEQIQSALESFGDRNNVLCYLCGPGPMIDLFESHLLHLGLNKQQIIFEKWW